MTNNEATNGMSRLDVEALLADVLVPVDPRPRFTKKLRARLVNYRGGRPFSGWTAIVVVASVVLMVASLLGMLIRFIGGGAHLIATLTRRQRVAG